MCVKPFGSQAYMVLDLSLLSVVSCRVSCDVCCKSIHNDAGASLSRCSRCHLSAYCCPEHQSVDWKLRHKNACDARLSTETWRHALALGIAAASPPPFLFIDDAAATAAEEEAVDQEVADDYQYREQHANGDGLSREQRALLRSANPPESEIARILSLLKNKLDSMQETASNGLN